MPGILPGSGGFTVQLCDSVGCRVPHVTFLVQFCTDKEDKGPK